MDIDLSCRYGSLSLRSPIMVGACSLTASEPSCLGMMTAGAGAVVLHPLFEEQVATWNEKEGRCESADDYLDTIHRLSTHLSIPVLASLNGQLDSDWIDFARELQFAGAAGIELHLHPSRNQWCESNIEDSIVATAKDLSRVIEIPLLIKLDRNLTSVGQIARRLSWVAGGVVMFGQAPSVEIDLDSLRVYKRWRPDQVASITDSLASLIHVREICPDLPIAANGGIEVPEDLIKVLIAGADVAMVTSAIYQRGSTAIGNLREGLIRFMERHHLTSLMELRSLCSTAIDSTQDRAGYVKAMGEF